MSTFRRAQIKEERTAFELKVLQQREEKAKAAKK